MDDFEKVRLCAGTIIRVQDFPKTHKSAYKINVDFGSEIVDAAARVTAVAPASVVTRPLRTGTTKGEARLSGSEYRRY